MSTIVGRTSEFIDNHVYTRRHRMRLPLTVSILRFKTAAVCVPCSPAIPGYLRDISKTGISLVVPTIRFGDCSLVSGTYPLGIMVELPNRAISVQVIPVRYDLLSAGRGQARYLIGARIMQITDSDRTRLSQHLAKSKKSQPRTFGFARGANPE
jgi:hypothetical protein